MDTPTITYVAAYATAATAAGTIALAGATYWLGRKTRDTARAAKDDLAQTVEQGRTLQKQTQAVVDQADAVKAQTDATAQQVELLRQQTEAAARQSTAAEAALNASVQPLLVDVPYGTILRVAPSRRRTMTAAQGGTAAQSSESDASAIYWNVSEHRTMLSFRVQNVGQGAARLQRYVLTYVRDFTSPVSVRVERSRVVAPGQLTLLTFSSDDEPSDERGWLTFLLESDEPLAVEMVYTDVAGRQGTATRLHLQKNSDGIYHVNYVDALVEPRFTRLDSTG